MNNNIRLIFNGMCEGCKEAELRLNMANVWNEEKKEYVKEWGVLCMYENVCQNTIERLVKRYEW